jgi:hypothetical protein
VQIQIVLPDDHNSSLDWEQVSAFLYEAASLVRFPGELERDPLGDVWHPLLVDDDQVGGYLSIQEDQEEPSERSMCTPTVDHRNNKQPE